jgi:transcriptional regulator with XRE-family HTH domain
MTPAEFRAARTTLGVSVSRMGRVIGISPTHVRRMEMDDTAASHRPVTETVERLVRAYLDGYRPPDWGIDRSEAALLRRGRIRKL